MSAGFSISRAKAELHDEGGGLLAAHVDVTVAVRRNVLTIHARNVAGPPVVEETTLSVRRRGNKRWDVLTAVGVWEVTRTGCNCGGR